MKKPILLLLSIFVILAAWSTVSADPIAEWISRSPVDANLRAKLTASWANIDSSAPSEQLDRFAQIAARLDPRVGQLAPLAPEAWTKVDLSSFDRDQGNYPPAVLNNLRLWLARKLAHASLYDEAGEQLAKIKNDEVLDPASLHFYRAVSAYRAMDKIRTAEAVKQLLACETTDGTKVPERYLAVARLMRADLASVKEESLDHIARRMEDIERRLDLRRSGKKVQDVEDSVIKSLDKLIEELEKQQEESSSGGDNIQSLRPADDSDLMGGKGPGRVTKKNIGSKDGWGNLPPKQREEAMQEVGRRFPAHYREAIEQYFRRMAE